jgi:MFS family permease
MRALQFSAARGGSVFRSPSLPEAGVPWREALEFCDRSSLTLLFGSVAGGALPDWVRERIARNLEENTERLKRVRALEEEVDQRLTAAGIQYVFLKGTTQWPHFVPDLRLRVQCDVDLFCPPGDARRAWDVFTEAGYEPMEKEGRHPVDHLPALVRKTGWEWRGGSEFDPDIPLAIEVHFQFWDERTERIHAPGVDEFWARRSRQTLDVPDALAYSTLHLLRHLLRGSVRPCHVYEVAWFLQHHADDESFWRRWQGLHSPTLRRLEAIGFRLAAEWFGCALSPITADAISMLPAPVQKWFETFALSPLEPRVHPNKDELWLHIALLDTGRDRLVVAWRRVVPNRLPGPVDAACLPEQQLTLCRRIVKYVRTAKFAAGRAAFHVRALGSLCKGGAFWWMHSTGLSEGYWLYLGASSFFVLGMFIYVMLYNLYLLDLGFREDLVGAVSSAATAGNVAAMLPAAALARRWGLHKLLIVSFATVGTICAVRAFATRPGPLLILAFLNGAAFSVYVVSLAPAVARLTSEKVRSVGFSISTASSIALGIVGGWLGGHLPGWLGGKRPAMLSACALLALALWPAARLRIGPVPAGDAKLYPRDKFIVTFLAVWAIWSLATGAFNPFFATFFARLHTPVERIGLIFSCSQLAQVIALLVAPLVLRKLGLVNGTAAMLMCTALALAGLAVSPAGWAVAAVFVSYTSCQWMSEPGINTLLMGRVPECQRTGVAALMMLVAFGAQFLASLAGGAAIAKFGYPLLLACAAAVAALAAVAFRKLPAGEAASPAEPMSAIAKPRS